MSYNDSTTIGEILRISSNVLNENDVFKHGKRNLAKIFLRELLGFNANPSDDELESSYKKCSPREDIPTNSEEFWNFIEKEYLHLELEPKIKFTELSFRVNEDLIALAENLEYIEKELKFLGHKKNNDGRLTANERYYKNQLEYFKDKNLFAKNEIVDFMTHKIKRYAITKSFVKSPIDVAYGSSLFADSPYAFSRKFKSSFRDPYDVRSLDEYSNKFMDLPASGYREIVMKCKSSPEKFKEYAKAYINGVPNKLPSVRDKIENLIEKSYILFGPWIQPIDATVCLYRSAGVS